MSHSRRYGIMLSMKYRDLEINFTIENVSFKTISIVLEKLTKPMPMHAHSKNSFEIHYISYGYGNLRTREGSFDITPGTLFVTGPGIEHEQTSDPENPMTEYCIYVKVDSKADAKADRKADRKAARNTTAISLSSEFLNHPFWFGYADSSFHELVKQIMHELERRDVGYELVLKALLQQLILYLSRKYVNDAGQAFQTAQGAPAVQEATAVQESPAVQEAPAAQAIQTASQPIHNDLTYLIIEEAFLYDYKDITLDSLSSQLGLGNRQTERLLKLHYGKSFQQKKTEARMSAACSLLLDGSRSVSDIAFILGYSSVEHFSGAFKKHMGITPSAYRKC